MSKSRIIVASSVAFGLAIGAANAGKMSWPSLETLTFHRANLNGTAAEDLGSSMGSMGEFRAVAALFKQGEIHPVVDSVHDAANAADAYARLESGEQFGKVVVRWG